MGKKRLATPLESIEYLLEEVEKLKQGGGGGGAVSSVNGKIGTVVLTASDIKATNTQTIQRNLERIDENVEDLIDGKLDANKQAISTVGGLVIPTNLPGDEEICLVATDRFHAQLPIKIGNRLAIDSDANELYFNENDFGYGTLYNIIKITVFNQGPQEYENWYVRIPTVLDYSKPIEDYFLTLHQLNTINEICPLPITTPGSYYENEDGYGIILPERVIDWECDNAYIEIEAFGYDVDNHIDCGINVTKIEQILYSERDGKVTNVIYQE